MAALKKVWLSIATGFAVGIIPGIALGQNTEELEEVVVKGRFIAEEASAALKLDVPVRDIPFTVTTYTDAFMTAIETTRMADLYKYMTGVQRAGNTGYDLSLRGFKSGNNDRNSIMVDGLPGLGSRFGSPPTINVDRIEVVKGPASVLYGQSQPGGFVNINVKRPQAERVAEFGLRMSGWAGDGISVGDNSGYTASADFSGPVGTSERFLYRLIAEYGDVDSFRFAANEQIQFLAPSITWKATDRTSATLALEYRHGEQSIDNFLVAPNRDYRLLAPRVTRYQQPDDLQKETGYTGALTVAHEFENGIKWNTAVRSVRNSDDTKGYESFAIRTIDVGTSRVGTTVGRRARDQINKRTYRFADSTLNIPFDTGGVSHQLLVGVNGGRETSDFDRRQFFNAPTAATGLCGGTTAAAQLAALGTTEARFTSLTRNQCTLDISIYAPNYLANIAGLPILPLSALPPGPGLNRRYTVNNSFGAYVTDLVKLSDNWKGMIGLRYSKERQSQEELKQRDAAGNLLPRTDSSASDVFPAAGILFQPNESWSYYLSYSTSFVAPASTALPLPGASLVPEEGKQVELGFKSETFDKRLSTTLALYRINKENAFGTVATGVSVNGIVCNQPACTTQNGEEQAQGLELEMNASVTDDWQVTFGYTYTDTEIKKTNVPAQLGSRLLNAPLHAAHIWSRYDFSSGPLEGFGFGLGLVYTGFRLGILPTVFNTAAASAPPTLNSLAFTMPGYATADLGLYYTRNRVSTTLRVSNLLNRQYIETGGFAGDFQIQPGAPRNVVLSFKYDMSR